MIFIGICQLFKFGTIVRRSGVPRVVAVRPLTSAGNSNWHNEHGFMNIIIRGSGLRVDLVGLFYLNIPYTLLTIVLRLAVLLGKTKVCLLVEVLSMFL